MQPLDVLAPEAVELIVLRLLIWVITGFATLFGAAILAWGVCLALWEKRESARSRPRRVHQRCPITVEAARGPAQLPAARAGL
jgi:hypothetical protein